MENEQELMMKLSMFEQQIQHLRQQQELVEKTIGELGALDIGLEELRGGDGKEILASVGRGIFVKAKLESEELTVDIGDKTFVKKSISETRKLIEAQLRKLEEVKEELNNSLEEVNSQFQKVFLEAQEKNETRKQKK